MLKSFIFTQPDPLICYLCEELNDIFMASQITSSIIMVRPAAFGFNVETAANNTFQQVPGSSQADVQAKAIEEFDRLVSVLRNEGVEVKIIEDTIEPLKPDAVFPNNWISFHEDGTVVTYPMYSSLRRKERRQGIIDEIAGVYKIRQQIHLENNESNQKYLEGTGSMVLDRVNRIAYACISPRTDLNLLEDWSKKMDYTPFTFQALHHGQQIYHTNVMMALGDGVAVVCLEVVDPQRGKELFAHLISFGREVVMLEKEQIDSFAGNMLAIRNNRGEQLMVMSAKAHRSLSADQKNVIERHARIISSDVQTIESVGGGSVRCMIAENFLTPI